MVETCGCKGSRFCGLCKDTERVRKLPEQPEHYNRKFDDHRCYIFANNCAVYCPDLCAGSSVANVSAVFEEYKNLFISNDNKRDNKGVNDINDKDDRFEFSGIALIEDFLSTVEEEDMVSRIDNTEWTLSQSGRRKQDYGPKVNFKQRKVKCDQFDGIPDYGDLVLKRLETFDICKFGNYMPFELCNLEYVSSRQSGIEFHQDDSWIWGERLISLNLLDDSVMTFEQENSNILVFVYMPRRSILCFSGDARYKWRHGIFSWHIQKRRISLTMREPGQDFRERGALFEKYGKKLIECGNMRIQTSRSD